MLTQTEIKLIQSGFGHRVDNGHSKINDVQDIIKTLEVSLENAKREKKISNNIDLVDNANADLIISFLEPMIKNLELRIKGYGE